MHRTIGFSLIGILALVNLFIWWHVSAAGENDLTVAFLDVGQGDAIFIETPDGTQMLVDGGPNKAVIRELAALMSPFDRSIDVVLATHPDADHIGGLPEVFSRFTVGMFIESDAVADTALFQTLSLAVADEGAEHVTARRGMVFSLGTDVLVRILFPDREMSSAESNSASVIVQVVYGDSEFLITGDAPQSVERYLVTLDGRSLSSDVLKVGHHGSKTSSAAEFLAAVSPAVAVISVGAENRYGHPHEEALGRLIQAQAEVIRTDEVGRVVFHSDGQVVYQK